MRRDGIASILCQDACKNVAYLGERRGGAPAPGRLHALDAVREGALLLGIVYHASYSFVPAPTKFSFVEDNHRSLALGVLVFTTHVFRMTPFFLIAGFLPT
jgi:glucans biosynthesis protein C